MVRLLKDPLLRWLGFSLGMSHLIVLYRWGFDENFAKAVLADSFSICWPFFTSCNAYRAGMNALIEWGLGLYGISALISMAGFLFKRSFAPGALLITTIIKAAIFLADYRFMGNYHYMLWWFSVAYFFIPEKRSILPILLVFFYFFSGLLKLNNEWLSGAALLREPIIQGLSLKIALIYVLILELVLVPLVIFFPRWRLPLLAQLAAFHAFSWHIVGYVYPLLMACMLLVLLYPLPINIFSWLKSRVAILFLLLFCFFQFIPWLISGDAALTGEGRLFSLNMLDAKVQCMSSVEIQKNHFTREFYDPLFHLEPRIRCDPYVHYLKAKSLCSGEENSRFRFFARKESDIEYLNLIDLDFCRSTPKYSFWSKNDWIHAQGLEQKLKRSTGDDSSASLQENGAVIFDGKMKRAYFASMTGDRAWLLQEASVDGVIPYLPGGYRVIGLNSFSGMASWVLPLPGVIIATPRVSPGKVLYVSTRRYDGMEHLSAISLRQGKQLYALPLPISIVEFELVADLFVIARTISGARYRISSSGWEQM